MAKARLLPGSAPELTGHAMSELASLETSLLAAVRDAATKGSSRPSASPPGKQGSISNLLKTLGGMTPDQRREQGPLINGLRDKVTAALADRRSALKDAALDARLAAETVDVTLPVRESAARERAASIRSRQVIDELTAIFADMGFAVAEGPDIETDDLQLHRAQLPGRPSRARDARHVLLHAGGRRRSASCCAPTRARCRSAR